METKQLALLQNQRVTSQVILHSSPVIAHFKGLAENIHNNEYTLYLNVNENVGDHFLKKSVIKDCFWLIFFKSMLSRLVLVLAREMHGRILAHSFYGKSKGTLLMTLNPTP